MELMLTHFDGRFDDETTFCKIRGPSAHRGTKKKKTGV
jgi:hypothetical protein